MSENNTEKKQSPAWLRPLIWVLIGVVAGIVIAYGIFTATLSQSVSTKQTSSIEQTIEDGGANGSLASDSNEEEKESTGISTYTLEHTELTGDDITDFQNRLISRIDELKNNNNFLQIQTGEDQYEVYAFNDKGECYAEDGFGYYNVVFRKDGKVVKFESESGAVALGEDIDCINIVKSAAQAINKRDDIKLYYYPIDEDAGYKEYRIDMTTKEAVRECYTIISDEFADMMIDKLAEQDENWGVHLVLQVFIPDDESDRAFGVNALAIYDNDDNEYLNWNIVGWMNISKWELEDWWYTYDFSKATEEEYMEHANQLSEHFKQEIESLSGDTDNNGSTDDAAAEVDEAETDNTDDTESTTTEQ